jgi:DinB superfamily
MQIVELLTASKLETEKYFNLPAKELSKTYAPGKWDIKKILVHLADAESILHERIKRVIAEPKQVIWAFNQDFWCTNLEYSNFPLEISKSLYLANRQSIIYLADKFYTKLGSNEFIHSETGLKTLQEEFDKVALHNQGHINQIKAALLTS